MRDRRLPLEMRISVTTNDLDLFQTYLLQADILGSNSHSNGDLLSRYWMIFYRVFVCLMMVLQEQVIGKSQTLEKVVFCGTILTVNKYHSINKNSAKLSAFTCNGPDKSQNTLRRSPFQKEVNSVVL